MKNNILRTLFFLILLLTGFTGPVWFFIVSVSMYIFIYMGFEVIILATAIDAYFGYASDGWFIYTVCATLGLLLAQWVKPYLWVYNQS